MEIQFTGALLTKQLTKLMALVVTIVDLTQEKENLVVFYYPNFVDKVI